jgi:hypothetical protein
MKNVVKQIRKIPLLVFCMLLYSLAITAQTEVIAKGVVVDENNEPIIGANIAVKGNKSIGTIADLDGNFQLKVPSSNSILVVSFIGMTTKEVKVETAKSIKIVL